MNELHFNYVTNIYEASNYYVQPRFTIAGFMI